MTRIWERLYLGGLEDAGGLFFQNPQEISTVISFCEDQVVRRNPAINYLHFPMPNAAPIRLEQFDGIMQAISKSIRAGKILVHCGTGASRSPVMVAGWMHVVGYKNIDEALNEIAALRPFVNPSDTLFSSTRRILLPSAGI